MNIQARFHPVITLTWCLPYLEGGQHLIRFLVGTGGNGVAGVAVRVNDRVSSLPADDDGPFAPRRTVELLHVTLLRHGGVGVTGNHGWDWLGKDGVYDEAKMAKTKAGNGRTGGGGGWCGDGTRRRGAAGC